MDQKKALSRTNTVIGSLKWWSSSSASSNSRLGGSTTISVQKLRESKWFGPDESRILCAVVERGFIVEIREGQENDSVFGVVHIKSSKGKRKRREAPPSSFLSTQTLLIQEFHLSIAITQCIFNLQMFFFFSTMFIYFMYVQ